MEISLALPPLHIQTSAKPVVGMDRLFGCIRAVTCHVCASKGMNNAPIAMRLCTRGEHSGVFDVCMLVLDVCLVLREQDVLDAAETPSYNGVQLINPCASLKQIRPSLC